MNFKNKFISIISIFWLLNTSSVLSYEILGMFPFLSDSHFNYNEQILKVLAKNHNVTMINPYFDKVENNITYYNHLITLKPFMFRTSANEFNMPIVDLKPHNIKGYLEYMKNKLSDKNFMDFLLSKKFDLFIIEDFGNFYKFFIPLSKVTSKKLILTTAFDAHSSSLSRLEYYESNYTSLKKNIFQDIKTEIINKLFRDTYKNFNEFHSEKFNIDNFDISEYRDKIYLRFSNSESVFYNEIKYPHFIELGGINAFKHEHKQIDNNVLDFIEKSKNGVILVSFGTVINETILSKTFFNVLFDTLKEIPQNVILKLNKSKVEGNLNISNNVMCLDYLQQQEILNHENVLGFVSHGGLNSVHETIFYAKPVVIIPFFGDQNKNADLIENKLIGKKVRLWDFNKADFLSALNSIVNNETYKINIKNLSKDFKTRETSFDHRINYWTDYVLNKNNSVWIDT